MPFLLKAVLAVGVTAPTLMALNGLQALENRIQVAVVVVGIGVAPHMSLVQVVQESLFLKVRWLHFQGLTLALALKEVLILKGI